MSYEKIKPTMYACVCEARKKDGSICGHPWKAEKLPVCCAKCKSRLWNGESQRRNKKYTLNGKTLSVAQWSKEIGVSRNTIYLRLWRGWSIEDVLEPGLFTAGRHPKEVKQ
jgi:hypothetical protein